jgi:hypothetical protein
MVNSAYAYPDLDTAIQINGLTIYQDAETPYQHYYSPPSIEIATTENGRPAFMLMMSRYVGARHLGDEGDWITRSFLSVRLRIPQVSGDSINAVKSHLRANGIANPRIKRLPLFGIEGAINFTPVDSDESISLPATGIVTQEQSGEASKTSQWVERTYSLALGNNDAQILSASLEVGKTLISFSYVYIARFDERNNPELEVHGDRELAEELKGRLADIASKTEKRIAIAHADALTISISPSDLEHHVSKIDINDRLPPGYASLDIYCYDFQQELVPGQFAKRVDIEALSPTGRTVHASLAFTKSTPEVYGQQLRISRAVDFAAPYRYRVVSVMESGKQEEIVAWTDRERWAEILDITTY